MEWSGRGVGAQAGNSILEGCQRIESKQEPMFEWIVVGRRVGDLPVLHCGGIEEELARRRQLPAASAEEQAVAGLQDEEATGGSESVVGGGE